MCIRFMRQSCSYQIYKLLGKILKVHYVFTRTQHITATFMFHNRLKFSHKKLRIVENSMYFIVSYFIKKKKAEPLIPLFRLQSKDSPEYFSPSKDLLKTI